MDLLQITSLLLLSQAVRGDYPAPSSPYSAPPPAPSTSYGAPGHSSYDSHGHGPVKRHVRGWYDGGSGGVMGHSSAPCCSPALPNPCKYGCGQQAPTQHPGYSQPQYPQPPPAPPTFSQPKPPPQTTYTHPPPPPQPLPSPPPPPHPPMHYPAPPPKPTYSQPSPQPPPPQPTYSPPNPPPTYPHPPPPPQPQPMYSQPPPPPPSSQPTYSPLPHPTYSQPPVYQSRPPPISQPPPYPLPEGPSDRAVGLRPDYLPRNPTGYGHGGYGLSTRPYNFGYSVRDFHTGADFKQQETSDGNTVKGQYRVQLPDGRTQIVTYTADWQTGFHADVQYEGEASYPAVYGTGGSFPPSTVNTNYGAPAQPSSSYGVPSHSSSSYSAPSTGYSASSPGYSAPSPGYSAPHGSYQSRVGVGGVGTQYQNIGHAPAGGSSHGHHGY